MAAMDGKGWRAGDDQPFALTDALLDFSGPADLAAWLKLHGG